MKIKNFNGALLWINILICFASASVGNLTFTIFSASMMICCLIDKSGYEQK